MGKGEYWLAYMGLTKYINTNKISS